MTSGATEPAAPERAMTLRNTNVPTNSVSRRARIETISGRASRPGLLFEHLAHRTLACEHCRAHHLAKALCDLPIRRLVPDERALDAGPAAALVCDAGGDVHVGGLVRIQGQLLARLGRDDSQRDNTAAVVAVELLADVLPAGAWDDHDVVGEEIPLHHVRLEHQRVDEPDWRFDGDLGVDLRLLRRHAPAFLRPRLLPQVRDLLVAAGDRADVERFRVRRERLA